MESKPTENVDRADTKKIAHDHHEEKLAQFKLSEKMSKDFPLNNTGNNEGLKTKANSVDSK